MPTGFEPAKMSARKADVLDHTSPRHHLAGVGGLEPPQDQGSKPCVLPTELHPYFLDGAGLFIPFWPAPKAHFDLAPEPGFEPGRLD